MGIASTAEGKEYYLRNPHPKHTCFPNSTKKCIAYPISNFKRVNRIATTREPRIRDTIYTSLTEQKSLKNSIFQSNSNHYPHLRVPRNIDESAVTTCSFRQNSITVPMFFKYTNSRTKIDEPLSQRIPKKHSHPSYTLMKDRVHLLTRILHRPYQKGEHPATCYHSTIFAECHQKPSHPCRLGL